MNKVWFNKCEQCEVGTPAHGYFFSEKDGPLPVVILSQTAARNLIPGFGSLKENEAELLRQVKDAGIPDRADGDMEMMSSSLLDFLIT